MRSEAMRPIKLEELYLGDLLLCLSSEAARLGMWN